MALKTTKKVLQEIGEPIISEAESSAHILRGLISYHERMTMGNYPERDFYLNALRYALESVEARRNKKNAAQGKA